MLPFDIDLRPGLPIAEQVVFAVKKAVVAGQLKPGAAFPSVRGLSQELKINPNTAQRIIGSLVAERVLLSTPGVGTVVCEPSPGTPEEKAQLMQAEIERLVVEARKLGLSLEELREAVSKHWRRLS